MRKLLLAFLFLIGFAVGAFFTPILVFDVLYSDSMSETLPMMPECYSLSEQGPKNTVAIVVKTISRPFGIVTCARVYNGTPKVCDYTSGALRLEGRWLGFVWLPYFGVRDLLSLILGVPSFEDFSPLPPGTYRDFYLPSRRAPASAGTYRVRLRYRVPPEEDERTVYSEEFMLP